MTESLMFAAMRKYDENAKDLPKEERAAAWQKVHAAMALDILELAKPQPSNTGNTLSAEEAKPK